MNGVVIPAPDFEAKPCFEFSQGKGGVLLTVIPPARFDIRHRRSRYAMYPTHDRAQIAFNVAPRIGLTRRAVVEPHTVALAAATKRLAVKFTSVIKMQGFW
jgi:hypothetical protein